MNLSRLITHAARPLRLLDRRSKLIEDLIDVPLSDGDAANIRIACIAGGKTVGDFYHWYLQKLLVSRKVRSADKAGVLDFISSVDATDYSQLSRVFDQRAGVVVAIPHHGHYIFSMIHLAEKLRHHRHVCVFYGRPSTHKGNEVFDSLHSVLWRKDDSVQVVHDTRQGMGDALRTLKAGGVVVIMPDVYTRESATVLIPFLGRAASIMLGTATLARKTGAWVLPAVARQYGRGLGYKTWFGERIDACTDADLVNPEQARIADYRVMRQLFRQYEPIMAKELMYWQFVRQHVSLPPYNAVPKVELKRVLELLAKDPLLLGASQTLDLRTVEAEAP